MDLSSTEIYSRVIILVTLLALSAIFSSSETALTSISLAKIRQLQEENEKKSKILKRIKHKMGDIISTILIGNNIVKREKEYISNKFPRDAARTILFDFNKALKMLIF